MLLGADMLISNLNRFWIASVVGEKGAGKDLLATELATMYLRKKWKLYTNQIHLWNDPLYRKVYLTGSLSWDDAIAVSALHSHLIDRELVWKSPRDASFMFTNSGMPEFVLIPNIRNRVVVLSEGGRYLREYKFFENLFEFARKFKNIFLFPSDRASHVDLMRFHVFPKIRFDQYFGIPGGLWGFNVDTGYTGRSSGSFIWLPLGKYTGVYDTEDTSFSPEEYLKAVNETIAIDNVRRGRDGLSALGSFATSDEMDAQITHQRNIQQARISLSSERKKSGRFFS